VVLVIVATGNHFFLDAAADALVAGLAALLTRRAATTWLAALQSVAPERIEFLNAHGTGTQLGNGLGGHNGCLVLGRGWTTVVLIRWSRSGSSVTGSTTCPGFDTSDFRSFAVRLDPHETRPPIDRSADTLLLVVEGSLTVVWRDTTRESTELGEGDTASTNPPALEVLLAGAEGATFLALVSRG
jgi:hypothetical protein